MKCSYKVSIVVSFRKYTNFQVPPLNKTKVCSQKLLMNFNRSGIPVPRLITEQNVNNALWWSCLGISSRKSKPCWVRTVLAQRLFEFALMMVAIATTWIFHHISCLFIYTTIIGTCYLSAIIHVLKLVCLLSG